MNKKLLAVAISGALTAPMAAQAIDYSISGHVNRMIRFADDGKASDIQQLDNSASRTRFRFRGSGDVGNGMKAGIYLETSVASNVSGATPLKVADGFDIAFDIRHSVLDFSGRWGKVSFGHSSGATDGIAFADLSGTNISGNENSSYEVASAVAFRTGGGASTVTVGGSRISMDGGRLDRLRYDSPALGPATVSVSVANKSQWEIAGYVDHEIAGGNLALYGGYQKAEQRSGFDQWAISGAFRFSQGTNIALAYGNRDFKGNATGNNFSGTTRGDSAENWYIKLGHRWGNNRISGSYGETTDGAADGADSQHWGVGFVHSIPKPGIELYASYHNFDLKTDARARTALGIARSTEEVNTFLVGTRIQFR